MFARRTSLLMMLAVLLTACATQPYAGSHSAPGFFMGLIHGLFAPLSLIGGLLTDARVYAFPNSGWWYDLGFMIGLLPWAGGGAAASSS